MVAFLLFSLGRVRIDDEYLFLPPTMKTIPCPFCGYGRAWKLRREKRKCQRCRHEFAPQRYPVAGFRVTEEEWHLCIATFLRERTIRRVTEEVGRSHCLVERMLMHVRLCVFSVVPEQFVGPMEMDETYIGGQRKNKHLHIRRIQAKRGHGTDKLPIVGMFDRTTGQVFVVVEPKKLDMQFITQIMTQHVTSGAEIYTDGYKMYRSLNRHGFRHAYVDHADGEYARGDVHTNNIEGFWGILKRKMSCIGGMQRQYLPLFVAEIVWKFNHRHLSLADQEKALMTLVLDS